MISLRPIVIAYASPTARVDLSALLDLDATLGRIVASTTEPMIGQLRLTWWYDQLAALGGGDAPAEPVLRALCDVVDRGIVTASALAAMVEGWEAVLEPIPLDETALQLFAQRRGEGLFALAADICDQPVPVNLGAGWALIDFAMHCSDDGTVREAVRLAQNYFMGAKLSGPKPLRILAHVARAKAMRPAEQVREPISRMMIAGAVLR